MTLKELKNVGRMLTSFLSMFSMCFESLCGRQLLRLYVEGQLSDLQRKNCEAIALKFGCCVRTLQRFLESIKWDEERLRDRCQEIVARDHAHPDAIGLIDESGIHKSGGCTAAAARQYNGNRGKLENCIVGVHLGYSSPGFQTLLDSRLYLPKDWADDPERRKKVMFLTRCSFRRRRRLPSIWSIERCAMGFASPGGHSTNCTVVTVRFSMGWKNDTNDLCAKSPVIREFGRRNLTSFHRTRARARVFQNRRPAKFVIC